jgi:hypothetical protein
MIKVDKFFDYEEWMKKQGAYDFTISKCLVCGGKTEVYIGTGVVIVDCADEKCTWEGKES